MEMGLSVKMPAIAHFYLHLIVTRAVKSFVPGQQC